MIVWINVYRNFLIVRSWSGFCCIGLSLDLHRLWVDYEWFPWSICNGCGMPAGNAYPSGHLVPSPVVGLACAPIVETRFLEHAMSLLDFSPRIPLGTFSILLTREKTLTFISRYKSFECAQSLPIPSAIKIIGHDLSNCKTVEKHAEIHKSVLVVLVVIRST